MDNSIKDINHSLSIQAETLGEPAETEASWYAMRVFMMVSSGDQEGLEYFEDGAFNWKKGERVRVIDGRFKGLEGEIKRINGDHRLIVSIDGVCVVATTYIPRCFLEKI